MKIKSQRDFWSGLMFVVVGVVFAVGATNYSMGTSARPGAGYFPLMLGVLHGDPRRHRAVQVADDRDARAAIRSARSPGGRC